MVAETGHRRPRVVGGGRSAEYAARHARGGRPTSYAPVWTDGAAFAVLEVLKAGMEAWHTNKTKAYCLKVLTSDADTAHLLETCRKRVSLHDNGIVRMIVHAHSKKIKEVMADKGADAALAKVHSFLKPLRERVALARRAGVLRVTPVTKGPDSASQWLMPAGQGGRGRSIDKCNRILDGVKKWPLGWLKGPAVIVYERAHGRIRRERAGSNGAPDEAFVRGLVKEHELPTLTANPADHYVVLEPGQRPRFATVAEVANSFMVPETSPLYKMLCSTTLKCSHAVSCLGRSIHVGVARALVALLMERGMLTYGLRYGSAYSGIDTFAGV